MNSSRSPSSSVPAAKSKTPARADTRPSDASVEGRRTRKAKVLLVDDHPITRDGMRLLINEQPNLEVCAEADDAAHAAEMVMKHQPDVAIVDISLKTVNGIEVTKNITTLSPRLAVLIVSFHDETTYAERSLRAGARGYLMKREATTNIIAAINQVLRGEMYVSDRIKENLLQHFLEHRDRIRDAIDALSDREVEVFHLLGNGFSTQQMAEKLNLSAKTIASHLDHLRRKLNLTSRSDLVRHAIRWARQEGA